MAGIRGVDEGGLEIDSSSLQQLLDFIVEALAVCSGFIVAAGADWATRRLGWNTTAA